MLVKYKTNEDGNGTVIAETTLSWMVDCDEDTLRIQLFIGDDCTGNAVNDIYVNNNECIAEFVPGHSDSLTYFDIHYCSKQNALENEPTPMPTPVPTAEPTAPVNSSDADMVRVFISVLFSLFMFAVY